MAMIKPHWKFSRFLEGYGDFAEPLKRWDWTPHVFAFEGSHFGSGIRGDNAQAANQFKMAQILEFTHTRFSRHLSSLPNSIWSPTSCGRLHGCRALSKRPTLSMQTAHWNMLAVCGNSHTDPREAGLFSEDLRFPENCRGGWCLRESI